MTIPVWHPLVVHFPIALLLVAGGAAAVWMGSGGAFWRRVVLLLVVLGAAGAAVARGTGEAMEEQAEGEPAVERYVERHEAAATWTLALAVAGALGVGALEARARRAAQPGVGPAPDPLAARLVAGGLVVAAAAFVVRTGHLGGLMVWGVGP